MSYQIGGRAINIVYRAVVLQLTLFPRLVIFHELLKGPWHEQTLDRRMRRLRVFYAPRSDVPRR